MSEKEDLRLLLKAMRRMARALDVHSSAINRRAGLTLPQLIVLECIRDLGEVTSRSISREADLSPPTVVGILDKLQAKGLIERYRSASDRRVVHTRLTGEGRAVLDQSPSPVGDRFERGFLGWPERERTLAITMFQTVADLFEDSPAKLIERFPQDATPILSTSILRLRR